MRTDALRKLNFSTGIKTSLKGDSHLNSTRTHTNNIELTKINDQLLHRNDDELHINVHLYKI